MTVSTWPSRWDRVDRPWRKPCWFIGRVWDISRCLIIAFLTIFSNIFIMWEVREVCKILGGNFHHLILVLGTLLHGGKLGQFPGGQGNASIVSRLGGSALFCRTLIVRLESGLGQEQS